MSFRFDWSTVASKELLRDIRTRINSTLYKAAQKDNYQGNTMHLLSLDLGTEVRTRSHHRRRRTSNTAPYGFESDRGIVLIGVCVVQEPEIKLLDINELSEEKVKMSFGFCYDGNATLKFRATVQVRPSDSGQSAPTPNLISPLRAFGIVISSIRWCRTNDWASAVVNIWACVVRTIRIRYRSFSFSHNFD